MTNPNPNPLALPVNGDRVTVTRDYDRYPHFIVPKGSTGTVDMSEWDGNGWIQVKWDDTIDGAEEWDNCLIISQEDLDNLRESDKEIEDWGEAMAAFFWQDFDPCDDDGGLGVESRNRQRAFRAMAALLEYSEFQIVCDDDRYMHAADFIADILHAVRVMDIAHGVDPADTADNCERVWQNAWNNFDAEAIHPDDLA